MPPASVVARGPFRHVHSLGTRQPKGTEISWSRGTEIPVAEYDSLYKQFNPTNFDADAWARTASDAGMKYLVFTTKHHDGF